MTTAAYAATVLSFSSVHLLWQGALIFLSYRLWQRATHPSPRVAYRAAVAGLFALLFMVGLNAVSAHIALVRNASRGNDAALAVYDTPWRDQLMQFADPGLEIAGVLILLWAIGTAVVLVRLLVDAYQVRGIVRSSKNADENVIARVAELAAQLRVETPNVFVSVTVGGPFVTGYASASMVLPAEIPQGDEWDALVTHELAHLARRDLQHNLWLQVAGCVLWFHPAVWLLQREAVERREEACDDKCVSNSGSALILAKALVNLADRRSMRPALSANDGSLTKRIHRLLQRHNNSLAASHVRHGHSRYVLAIAVFCASAGAGLSVWLAPASDQLAVRGAISGALSVARIDISAHDPAGKFTIRLLNGRVAAATVGGIPIASAAIRRTRSTVSISNEQGARILALQLGPRGSIH